MYSIGFTGTQEGMTAEQQVAVRLLLAQFKNEGAGEFHHGVCVGADEQAHDLATELAYDTVGHPGLTQKGLIWRRSERICDVVLPAKFFLDRNTDIVKAAEVVIATPKEYVEVQIGSGTWATIRRAKKLEKKLYIVYPNGVVEER